MAIGCCYPAPAAYSLYIALTLLPRMDINACLMHVFATFALAAPECKAEAQTALGCCRKRFALNLTFLLVHIMGLMYRMQCN